MPLTRRLLLLFLLAASTAAAQDSSSAAAQRPSALGGIDTIIVTGNKTTKDFVILDEMALKPGSVATPEAMEFDRSRIYSLGLFTRVDMNYDSLDHQKFLFVSVSERWFLIPTLDFGFRDGDPGRPFYGGGFLHTNFRGRNQQLELDAMFGHDPSVAFAFSDPLIDRDNRLYFNFGMSGSRVRNKSEKESMLTGNFDERHYDIHAGLGKRFDRFQFSGVQAGYHIVSLSEYFPRRTASTTGEDRYVYAIMNYTYDSRDLREYASHGRSYSLSAMKSGFGEGALDFWRFGADLRHFIGLTGDLTFASRVSASLAGGGMVPTYARAYIGFGDKIRGYYGTTSEGDNMAIVQLELRYPILKEQTIIFSAIPIPEEFAVWRFGVSAAVFTDAGTTWFRGQSVAIGSFASGYGAGLHFLLPYGLVARMEYAWNEYGKGQLVLDLKTSI